MYVVYQYAEFYHMQMKDVHKIGVIEFLNHLAFMKEKSTYDIEIQKELLKHGRAGR